MKNNTSTESYSRRTKDFLSDALVYRKQYNDITGSVTASILLNQIIWRYLGNQEKPFYKFIAPCKHRLYRDGDSWLEEVGFTKNEFIGAIDRIATKITKGISKAEVMERMNARSMVVYWTDAERVTHWEVNTSLINLIHDAMVLGSASATWDKKDPGNLTLNFGSSDLNPKTGISYVNPKSGFSNSENRIYIDPYSEKTTESVYREESHTPDQDLAETQDLPEQPTPVNPDRSLIETENLGLDPENGLGAAAAKNALIPVVNAPSAPVYGLPDESAIIAIWNAKKAKGWLTMGPGILNGNMIDGLRFFMNQAGGDKALAVEYIGKAIEVAAQDNWTKDLNLKPYQGLDPFCKTFIGQFLAQALADPAPAPPVAAPSVPADFKLDCFLDTFKN